MKSQEEPGGAMSCQEEPKGARRSSQEEPRRSPGGGMGQEEPGRSMGALQGRALNKLVLSSRETEARSSQEEGQEEGAWGPYKALLGRALIKLV